MNPRLLVLAGLPDAETINLNLEIGESFTLGRDVECDLPIGNIAISRQHCRITRCQEEFYLEDLESHNGTFVNDLQVKSHLLAHGDRINVGNSHIMFLTREDNNINEPRVELDDGSLIANSTLRLFANYDTGEFSPDLNILVNFGKALNEVKEIKALQRRFLEIILEFIPARRGAIIVTDENLDEPQAICLSSDESFSDEPMQISRTVCRQVLVENISILSNDLSATNLNTAESLITAQVTSLLCVPFKLSGGDGSKGLIYLDSDDRDFYFTETHLVQMIALSFLIASALANAESLADLQKENALLKAGLQIESNMIGESRAMYEVFYLISKVAPNDSIVLIGGESGTGKELVAKAIHQNSLRRAKPFIAINCAVLSENLLESELFGYEKGAFTGAFVQKKGKLELAEGGTIFLDEIGELAPLIQAKLLRVLQEREFERVGGTRSIKADVRIIAATNRNLEEEVKKGTFRQDLFFRLNVVRIKMPPLRERKSDIPLLAQHFIKKYSEKCNRKVTGLAETTRKILINHHWQGNVRELENIIERAIVLGATEMILPEDLPSEILEVSGTDSEADSVNNFHDKVKFAKQKIITEALQASGNNYTEAARRLGLHPNNLHRLIRNLGIKN